MPIPPICSRVRHPRRSLWTILTCLLVAALAAFWLINLPAGADDTSPPPDSPPSPLPPAEAQALMQVDSGLRIELVAAEPEVVDPVEIAFDARGRMWVVEMGDYPNGPPPDGPPRGRIKILEDKDGDGRFETARVFAEGLLFANGLIPWGDGVIVTSAPAIEWLRDTDGDGKVDIRTPLYRGFTEGNPQLRVSHPTLGLDGWVYVANGLRGGKVVPAEEPDAEPIDLSGKDFRFDPVGGAAEAISGMGQYGLTFDAWGQRFVCDNRHHLRHMVFPDHHARRNPLLAVPAVVQDVPISGGSGANVYAISRAWTTSSLHAGQFTAACGVHIYGGDALPEPYRGAAFTCEPTGNLVHMEIMEPHGASFRSKPAREGVEFLASPETWFRPVNLTTGPDGALYVVDMYRAVIEHPEFMPPELKERPDLRDGDTLGRIWRIVPEKGEVRRESPRLDAASSDQLIDLLGHPNSWHRDTARRLLIERRDSKVLDRLRDVARSTDSNPLARVQAAWLLNGADALDEETVRALLESDHPRVRSHGAALAESRLDALPELRAAVLRLADDPDAQVRYQAAISLGATDVDAKTPALATIALRGAEDSWTRLAVVGSAQGRAGALLGIVLERIEQDSTFNPGRLALVRELSALVGTAHEPGEVGGLIRNLGAYDGPNAPALRLAALDGLVEGLGRGRVALGPFLDSLKDDGAQARTMLADADAMATDESADTTVRLAAIRLLAHAPWERAEPVLTALLHDDPAQEIRVAAVRALGAQRNPDVPELLMEGWQSYLPAVRREVADAMLRDPARTRRLLAGLEEETVRPGDLDATQVRRLTQHGDQEIRALAGRLLGRPEGRLEALKRYEPAITMTGDPDRGRAVFESQCATCHHVAGIGTEVGPDIADTRVRTREALLTDILDPNRAIDGNYVGYIVATTDGNVLDGVIAAETASSLTLRRPEGRTEILLRRDIEAIRSTGQSLMPEGLEANISVEQMADLITFLKDWRYLEGDVPLGRAAAAENARPDDGS